MTPAPNYAFAEFQQAVDVLEDDRSSSVRAAFLSRLVETGSEEAREQLRVRTYGDGPAHDGYMWSFLRGSELVPEDEVWARLTQSPRVYAMWDVLPFERIPIADYYRFPRWSILSSSPDVLRRGLSFLPEDLYMFDDSMLWAGVLTHECIDDARYCVWGWSPGSEAGGL